jgi:hypothetical protein
MPCSPLKFRQSFGGICRLPIQGRRINRTRNQHESTWQAEHALNFIRSNAGAQKPATPRPLLATCIHSDFLLGLFFNPEDRGEIFLRNVRGFSKDYMALYPRRQNSS